MVCVLLCILLGARVVRSLAIAIDTTVTKCSPVVMYFCAHLVEKWCSLWFHLTAL